MLALLIALMLAVFICAAVIVVAAAVHPQLQSMAGKVLLGGVYTRSFPNVVEFLDNVWNLLPLIAFIAIVVAAIMLAQRKAGEMPW